MGSRVAVCLLAIGLTACPPPTIVHLYNHTLQALEYCKGRSCRVILPSTEAEVPVSMSGGGFGFTITIDQGVHEYEVESLRNRDYAWRLETGNHFHVVLQVEPSLSLFLVPPDSQLPVSTPLPQPDGFPLRPLSAG